PAPHRERDAEVADTRDLTDDVARTGLLPGEEAEDQEQDAACCEQLVPGRHAPHVESGRTRTFHPPLLSAAARVRGRCSFIGYPRGGRGPSQTPCEGSRSTTVIVMPAATAIAPPATPSHGPQEATWNVGGNAIASAEATVTTSPATITSDAGRRRSAWSRHAATANTT